MMHILSSYQEGANREFGCLNNSQQIQFRRLCWLFLSLVWKHNGTLQRGVIQPSSIIIKMLPKSVCHHLIIWRKMDCSHRVQACLRGSKESRGAETRKKMFDSVLSLSRVSLVNFLNISLPPSCVLRPEAVWKAHISHHAVRSTCVLDASTLSFIVNTMKKCQTGGTWNRNMKLGKYWLFVDPFISHTHGQLALQMEALFMHHSIDFLPGLYSSLFIFRQI